MHAPTAILLFARTATAEARAKRFGRRGRRIGEALLRRTEETLARTGLPVYRSSEREQQGADFGSRITRAIRGVFERGHDRVLVVGSDCPTLSAATLRRAVGELERGRQVIGPDARGGAYLIGLQRKSFREDRFAALAWQSPRLARQLTSHLADCFVLATRADYNDLGELRGDVAVVKRSLPDLAWLFHVQPSAPSMIRLQPFFTVSRLSLRGPPGDL